MGEPFLTAPPEYIVSDILRPKILVWGVFEITFLQDVKAPATSNLQTRPNTTRLFSVC